MERSAFAQGEGPTQFVLRHRPGGGKGRLRLQSDIIPDQTIIESAMHDGVLNGRRQVWIEAAWTILQGNA